MTGPGSDSDGLRCVHGRLRIDHCVSCGRRYAYGELVGPFLTGAAMPPRAGDELAGRRDEHANDGVTYEWPAVVAYAREFAAEMLAVLAARLVSQDVEDMRVYDEIRGLRDDLAADGRPEFDAVRDQHNIDVARRQR